MGWSPMLDRADFRVRFEPIASTSYQEDTGKRSSAFRGLTVVGCVFRVREPSSHRLSVLVVRRLPRKRPPVPCVLSMKNTYPAATRWAVRNEDFQDREEVAPTRRRRANDEDGNSRAFQAGKVLYANCRLHGHKLGFSACTAREALLPSTNKRI